MKWLADENIPWACVNRLRSDGVDIVSIRDFSAGAADERVLEVAVIEQRALLTFDRDFGELIFRQHQTPPPCLVYLRFRPKFPDEPALALFRLLQAEVDLFGSFIVLDRDSFRRRRLPK